LLDFAGGELLSSGLRWETVNEFKEDAGEYLKQAIEDAVGFHGYSAIALTLE
jgi:hypothetical protein